MSEQSQSLFPTTQWTLVHLLHSEDRKKAALALDRLCRAYYRPLYVSARASGLTTYDSEDAVQDFFAHVLGNDALKTLDQEKGRLRHWIGRAFSNRLHHNHRLQSAQKRGGGEAHLPLDFLLAEQLYQSQHLHDPSAEHACDLRTALDLWQETQRRLDSDQRLAKRPEIYSALRHCILTGWPSDGPTQSEVAGKLGISVNTFRVRLYNLTRKARDIFAEVARENLDPLIPSDDLDYLWHLLRGD